MIKGIILAIISACAYATLPVIGKIGYDLGLTTIQMLAYRFCFGFATLALFFLFSGERHFFPPPGFF